MTFDLHIAERRLRNASRFIFYSMWLLFAVAAALAMIVRHSAPARTGSLWIFACAVLALGLSFALRDAVRKMGHRNTEDRIVRDVQAFLERQPALQVGRSRPPKALPSQPAIPAAAADPFVPSKWADFVPMSGAAARRAPAADPVVFDSPPSRRSVAVTVDFRALPLPPKP